MRNIITYSVFVMLFSMFSGSVFAGQYQECEPFKGMKRLYGLCNAYQNAFNAGDVDAMADIYANWKKWAPDVDLPNSPDTRTEPLPEPSEVACPCTDGMDTTEWGITVSCSGDGIVGLYGMFVVPETNFSTDFYALDEAEGYTCGLMQSPAIFLEFGNMTYGEFDACMSQLETLCSQ
jgi:hypothetical protein